MSILTENRLTQYWRPGSRGLKSLPYIAVGCDAAVIAGALGAAVVAREFLWPPEATGALSSVMVWFAPALGLLWSLCLVGSGSTRTRQFGAGTDEYKLVVRASVAAAALGGLLAYSTGAEVSRSYFATVFGVGIPLLVLERYLLRRGLHSARRAGRFAQQTLVIGAPDHVDALASVLRREVWLGYRVLGALTPRPLREETEAGVPVLGCSESAADIARRVNADVLLVADGAFGNPAELRQLAWELEHHDVQVVLAPAVTDVAPGRVQVRPVGGLPLVHLERPRAAQASQWLKRSFDVLGSLTLLFLLLPTMVFVAARIWTYDRGPVLFRQARVGRDGQHFTCLKFRSMRTDAEDLREQLKEEQGFEGGLFKMEDDPRVTAPGRWMRRLSLDELPQLLNVLRGDMSLIGPRPPLPEEVAEYDEMARRRLRVLPGMTGLWQVSGRSNLSFEDAVRLDLYYVDNWSMLQDLTILARTVRAVVRGEGAV